MRKTSIAALAAAAHRHHRRRCPTRPPAPGTPPPRCRADGRPGNAAPPPQNNAAIEWNQALLAITSAPPVQGAAPSTVQPTRNFAILALAIDTAVNAIDHTHQPTTGEPTAPPGASAPAAAVTAAHDALVALYPAHRARPRHPAGQRSRDPAETTMPPSKAFSSGGRAAQIILDSPGPGRRRHPAPALRGRSSAGPLPAHSAGVGAPGVHRLGHRSCRSCCTAAISSGRRRHRRWTARPTPPR